MFSSAGAVASFSDFSWDGLATFWKRVPKMEARLAFFSSFFSSLGSSFLASSVASAGAAVGGMLVRGNDFVT